jgi:hypothetical protein
MARASKLRRRALQRMSVPPRENRPSGIELRDVVEAEAKAVEVERETPPAAFEVPERRAASEQSMDGFEPEEEEFFSSRTKLPEFEDASDLDEPVVDRHSQLEVVNRRARASRIVTRVLAACAAVVVVGVGVHTLRGGAPLLNAANAVRFVAQPVAREVSPSVPVVESAAARAAAVAAQEIPAPIVDTQLQAPAMVAQANAPSLEAPAAVAPSASGVASAAPVASAQPVASAALVASAQPVASAASEVQNEKPAEAIDVKAEKRLAERALDQGKLAQSIEHAARAVEGDATDANAWLLLGAAKQAKGDAKGSREAFSSCVKQAKVGPRNECAAMLR